MPLSERSRTTIYQTFEPLLGEEVAADMLAQFPTTEELATKEFVRAEIATLRGDLHDVLHRQTMWLMGAMVTVAGLTVGAVGLLK